MSTRLTEPDHERALRVGRVADVVRHLLGPAQHVERAIPAGPLPNGFLETADGLEIVIEDVWPSVHHRAKAIVRSVEVRDQDLDPHPRAHRAHGPDRLGEYVRAAIGKVVSCYRSDHHMG